jgi:hypothetical protein
MSHGVRDLNRGRPQTLREACQRVAGDSAHRGELAKTNPYNGQLALASSLIDKHSAVDDPTLLAGRAKVALNRCEVISARLCLCN